jgi:imidazolonepropionase-like amidohydrolase/pimeloyl-ACP methyl ester carboxylesterase
LLRLRPFWFVDPEILKGTTMNRTPRTAWRYLAGALPLALALSGCATADRTDTIAFTGADVLTMTERGRLEDATLIVREGRIVAIRAGDDDLPAGATVIDAEGQVIIPGLIDMHAHLPPLPGDAGDAAWRALTLYAVNGVTTVRSMAGHEAHLALRERVAGGELWAPAIVAAAPAININTAATPDAAEAAVRRAAADGFDLVKAHHIEDPAVYDATIRTASEVGLPVAGHVSNAVGLDRALRAGQQIEHLDGYLHALLPIGSPLKNAPFGQIPPDVVLRGLDWDRLDPFVARTVEAGVANTPTLALFEQIADIDTPASEKLAAPFMQYAAQPAKDNWATQQSQLRASGMMTGVSGPFVEARRRITRALHEAGAPIMAGADAPQGFMVPGFSIHQELESLAEAGLSPTDALRAATAVPSAYFADAGYDVTAGTLAVGSPADLVLLTADPEKDIDATRAIAGVMIGGKWQDRAQLDARLEEVRASVAPAQAAITAGHAVFLVRHAEAGTGEDPALTPAGRRRAEALADQLADVPLTAIYVTDTARARETAAPLAERLGLSLRLYDPRALDAFAVEIADAEGAVLVVGHSNTTPALVERLEGEAGEPIAHDEHDRLYWLDRGRTRRLVAGGVAPLLLAPCRQAGVPNDAFCGTLTVPEGGPAPRDIGLNVAWLPSPTPSDAPPLVVLPGGPGLGGVQIAGGVRQMLAPITEGRDVLLVDQRGTGRSNPLACDEAGQTLGEAMEQLASSDTAGVIACRDELAKRADLTRYTTDLAAADLDLVRQALGEPVLDIFGMSYGTRLGLEYMRQSPDGTGVAILRAAAPPSMMLPFWTARDAQSSLDLVIAACAAQAACAAAYPDLEGDVDRVLARLGEGPVRVTVTDPRIGQQTEVSFSSEAFGTSLFFLLYIPELYAHLPRLVHAAAEDDYQPLVQTLSPIVASTLGQIAAGLRLSVICAEDVAQIDEGEIADATRGTFFGDRAIRGDLAACEAWPTAELPADYFAPVSADHPTLVISGSFDPVAGPNWGDAIMQTLPNALHLVVEGASHYPPLPGCTGQLARQLLDERSLDAIDATCAADPMISTFAVDGDTAP